MVDAPVQLTAAEARVLGCLIEKALTTPDAYPLSLNSLRLACNQTTNRDPVVAYDEVTVEDALEGLRAKQLATRSKAPGERAIKHRHRADETLAVDPAERALLGVLLLRGAQTPGELKARTDRLHGFTGPGDVEATLAVLADRGFVHRLDRRPGQKESRWAQLLADVPDGAVAAPTEPAPAQPRAAAAELTTAPSAITTISVVNPASGEPIRTVNVDDETEIAGKLRRARAAQRAWAARPYAERAQALLAWRDLLAAEIDECARITSEETGKPIAAARNEVRAVQQRISWFVEHVPRVIARRVETDTAELEERVTYEPRGVVAHVSAWNYPYFVGLNSIVPALACGNAVLYKPSEHALLTGLQLVDLAHRAGVAVDALQAVVGDGATGASLVASGIDLLCFTGSVATGRRVAVAAAERLVPVQLELGGKDAAYVCDDVDVVRAATTVAEGVFYHGGQSCCAVERVYVHERIWERFVSAFVDAARAWSPGDPRDEHTAIGPLARVEQPDLVQRQVDDARAKGARVLLGGERPDGPGAWYPPTVLVDVDHTMAVMRDESFGPVIGLMRVRDDDDALARVDDTTYGLTAAIFTDDRDRAERFLARCDAGSVYWNCSDRTSVCLPWAGRRESGLGVSMGLDGIRAFVRPKAWHFKPASR
jgi:acyl-CoA reductase-like NAD-dependent aldehyde dehydrogenase